MAEVNKAYVCVGLFRGCYAVQGWLKLQSFTDPDEAIIGYQPWYVQAKNVSGPELENPSGELEEIQLLQSRRHGKGFVVQIAGVENPEQAQAFNRRSIFIKRSQLPALKNGSYYWVDLIGLRVINRNRIDLGRVVELLETGANDVLVVAGSGKQYLIPYVRDLYVINIDVNQGEIVVDWDSEWTSGPGE